MQQQAHEELFFPHEEVIRQIEEQVDRNCKKIDGHVLYVSDVAD